MRMTEKTLKKIPIEKTAFIIGSGPSLNKVDIKSLSGLNTFGMNRQYISYKDWGFYPKYYTCVDRRLSHTIFTDRDRNDSHPYHEVTIFDTMLDNDECDTEHFIINGRPIDYDELVQREADRRTFREIKKDRLIHYECQPLNIKNIYGDDVTISSTVLDGGMEPPELHGLPPEDQEFYVPGCTCNCGVFATVLAMYMGYELIVLVGIDAHYKGRDSSIEAGEDIDHYDPHYFDLENFPQGTTQGSDSRESTTLLWNYFDSYYNSLAYDDRLCIRCRTSHTTPPVISCSPDSHLNKKVLPYFDLHKVLSLLK